MKLQKPMSEGLRKLSGRSPNTGFGVISAGSIKDLPDYQLF
jgi:hypothetical protein